MQVQLISNAAATPASSCRKRPRKCNGWDAFHERAVSPFMPNSGKGANPGADAKKVFSGTRSSEAGAASPVIVALLISQLDTLTAQTQTNNRLVPGTGAKMTSSHLLW
jgi:hypothetical protein